MYKHSNTTVVGLDVHKELIVTGVLPPGMNRAVESVRLENSPSTVKRMAERLGARGPVEFVYEAGPCGYEVYRTLTGLGYPCAVIAPGLVPKRAGDRVKTDRLDAEKLARLWRAGELTPVRVPSSSEEAARDLVRAREDALRDRLRQCHRLTKFLLRRGQVYREGRAWGVGHRAWLRSQKFEEAFAQQTFEAYVRAWEESEARLATLNRQVEDLAGEEPYKTPVAYLRCLKGIETLSAITILVEAQDLRRFAGASSFMKFTGMTSSERTSVDVHRGRITKAGNAHIRRVLVEGAWSYARANGTGLPLRKRREGCPPEVVRLAKKAQDRLHRKFHRMRARNKPMPKVVTAVARELAGFAWGMARHFPVTTI